MKNSFVLFTEQKEILDKLTDAQAGKIMKAIYEYEATGVMPELGEMLDTIIIPFKLALDKMDNKWEETKQKRVEAGRLGGINRAKKYGQQLSNESKECLDMLSKSKQTQANLSNAKQSQAMLSKPKQTQANQAVNVNVNVNDNVNVNVNNKNNINNNKKENIKRKSPTLDEVEQYVQEKDLKVDAKQFFDYFEVGNWIDAKGNKVKNWKQKLLTWNKYADRGKEVTKPKYQNYEQRQYNTNDLNALYSNAKK